VFNSFKNRGTAGLSLSNLRWLAAALMAVAAVTAQAADDFLEPEKAFVFSSRQLDAQTLEVSYKIADGYYMYHDKFAAKADVPAVQLGAPVLPAGKIKFDETFQKNVETHRGTLTFKVPVQAADGAFKLLVTGQGCADAGLCYPPMTSEASFAMKVVQGVANALSAPAQAASVTPAPNKPAAAAGADTESRIAQVLANRSYLAGIALFFGIGLLLTFTPCVLPMIPILSSIIVGQGGAGLTRGRGFALSAAYVMGMALVYTAVGVAAGMIGEGLTSALQNPWVLGTFALMLVILSLSMFGFYELQLPTFLRDKLTDVSGRQQGGNFAGVFIMGALSAVIVGPCVTAPLAATLAFIAQSKDALFGGTVLFAMALGMGVPLLLVGLGAGSILPRAGGWMESVKHFFGVLLIATAIWMISPVIPDWLHMLAWAALLIICASYLRVFDSLPNDAPGFKRLSKGVGVLALLAGVFLLVGVASGGRDVLQPLAQLKGGVAGLPQTAHPVFQKVKSVSELDQRLASLNGKPALLDFWAEWCVACKEMERFTFNNDKVAAQMNGFVLLQADVTGNTAEDKALLKRFGLFGPPGIIFFDANGKEVLGGRVIGFQNAEKFLGSLDRVSGRAPAFVGLADKPNP
jgi:thioredoxin:protein disulfide reductase